MKIISLILIQTFFLTCISYGAEGRNTLLAEHTRLLGELKNGNPKAALELGRSGDISVIPTLKAYAELNEPQNQGVAEAARLALAKLGERKYFEEVLSEFKQDVDVRKKAEAVKKLGYIGTKECIKDLAEYIDTPLVIPPLGDSKTHISVPLKQIILETLGETVPNPPVKKKAGFFNNEDVAKWKKWWQENKSKFN